MKSSRLFVLTIGIATLLPVAAAHAAKVDMSDPRRALGRQDDVRIDAQLVQDTVAPGAPLTFTVQIENLSGAAIAVASKNCDVSYDQPSGTITVAIGSEVPKAGLLPRLLLIGPGETKTFTTGATFRAAVSRVGSPVITAPRLVEIKVNIQRDLAALASLINRQKAAPQPLQLSDSEFEQWLEHNDTIFLNSLPIHYNPNAAPVLTDAAQAAEPAGGR